MRNHTANERPTMTWVEVRDGRGRMRMEARWIVPGVAPAKPHAA